MAVNTSPDSISLDEVEGSWKSRHNCYRDRERTLVCRHSPWALAAGWQLRGYQSHTGRDWVVWLQGKSWRDSFQCPWVESLTSTANQRHLSWVGHSSQMALARGATLAPAWQLQGPALPNLCMAVGVTSGNQPEPTLLFFLKNSQGILGKFMGIPERHGVSELCGFRVRAVSPMCLTSTTVPRWDPASTWC